jgi:hypothetical protein
MRLLFFLALLPLISVRALGQQVCAQLPAAFSAGEELYYRVSYRWGIVRANAGAVSLTADTLTRNGQPLYHFVAIGRTTTRYDIVYRVRDRFESLARRVDLRPVQYLRDTDDGGFKVYNNNFFDHRALRAVAWRRRDGVERVKDTIAIHACTYDAVSMFYNARSIDMDSLAKGERLGLSVYLDEKVYDLTVRYVGLEEVKLKRSRYRCHRVVTEVIAGSVFDKDAEMTVWFTADDNRVPVLIEAPLRVGRVRAELTGAKGLRHELSAVPEAARAVQTR